MTDEKDPKEGTGGVKPDEHEPSVAKAEVAKAAETPAEQAPISKAQAEAFERKVEADAHQVQVAQPKTHEEHIDHVLTRGHPMKPAHTVSVGSKPTPTARVRLAYSSQGMEPEEAPHDANKELKPRRLLAEYDTTSGVLHAAESLRDAGYKTFDAHSPFPVHGMDAAMGLKDSRLGWIVLLCGLTGVTSAWLLMYWTNGIDYPLIIGGKPPGALPSMVPIMFELTVLLSSFGAVFGMFGLNRLPQHHDPLFYSDRFAAFSNDKFFISVDADDPKFDLEKTRKLLEKTKPQTIEVIETLEEAES